MLIQKEIQLEIPLKESLISDEELLEALQMRIYPNKYYTNEAFRLNVLEICNGENWEAWLKTKEEFLNKEHK